MSSSTKINKVNLIDIYENKRLKLIVEMHEMLELLCRVYFNNEGNKIIRKRILLVRANYEKKIRRYNEMIEKLISL